MAQHLFLKIDFGLRAKTRSFVFSKIVLVILIVILIVIEIVVY